MKICELCEILGNGAQWKILSSPRTTGGLGRNMVGICIHDNGWVSYSYAYVALQIMVGQFLVISLP